MVLGDAVDLYMLELPDDIHNVVSVVAFKVVKEHRNSFSQPEVKIARTMSGTSKFPVT